MCAAELLGSVLRQGLQMQGCPSPSSLLSSWKGRGHHTALSSLSAVSLAQVRVRVWEPSPCPEPCPVLCHAVLRTGDLQVTRGDSLRAPMPEPGSPSRAGEVLRTAGVPRVTHPLPLDLLRKGVHWGCTPAGQMVMSKWVRDSVASNHFLPCP